MRIIVLLALSLLWGSCYAQLPLSEQSKQDEEKYIIAFGSCNHQDRPQPLWKDIIAENPNLWIWLGDNIYGDSEYGEVLKQKYTKQKNNKDYQLLAAKVPIVGTWDDHDFGVNNGDKTYPQKALSRDLALDFLGVPDSAKVRNREGIYQEYVYAYAGLTIRLLLLDTRYFKDPLTKKNRKSLDILGSQQWAWLEKALKKEEDILIVANGTQVVPDEHRFEKWADYPKSRKRLLKMLNKDRTDNIILLSGDRHIGEISKINIGQKTVYEVTSSGLTHSYTGANNTANKYRVGQLTNQLNYGMIHIYSDKKIKLILSGLNTERHLEVDLPIGTQTK